VLTKSLYEVSRTVLTNPVVVANAYILKHGKAPLGYLPVQKFLKLDPCRNEVKLVQQDEKGRDSWHIIPYHYRYYEDNWHPALSVKRPRPSKDSNKKPADRWGQHLAALSELESYLSSISSPYTEHIGALLTQIQDENKVVDWVIDHLKLSTGDSKTVEDALYIPWLFLWDGVELSEIPDIIEWQREQFVLKGYAHRLAEFKLEVEYLDGRAHIRTPDTFTSVLTGEVITDPCIYMVPNLVGGKMEQLISFDKDSFGSYGMKNNLNAPMGLDESWWVAAAASIVFQDNRFSAHLGDNVGITFLPKGTPKLQRDLLDDLRELGIEIEAIVENSSGAEEELDPDTRAAHRAAVEAARQFRTGLDKRSNVAEGAEVIAVLREKAQGRSPIRYYSELPVGAANDTSHSTARGRFYNLKSALRISSVRGEARVISLISIIQMLKKVYAAKKSQLPSDVYTELWRCSYDNKPYPPSLVQMVEHAALNWIAHDSHIQQGKSGRRMDPILVTFDDRYVLPAMAFLKAHLYFSGYEVSAELSYGSKSTWYNFGRVVAICQWFQRLSLGGKQTNIEDSLTSIQSQPNRVAAFVLQTVVPHIKKVARNNGDYEMLMTELGYALNNINADEVSGTTRLDNDQLALVMLGYFQQLVKLFSRQYDNKKEDNDGEEHSNGTD
jgi:hypothetical protein